MRRFILSATAAMLVSISFGGDYLLWQDSNVGFLYGTDFEVNPETQQTLTVEHASGWFIGDLYFFTDFIYYDGEKDLFNGSSTYYGELAPRLSAGKIIKKDLSVLFVQDWLLATCYEFGENDLKNYLVGPGIDMKVPGFDFFQLNLYRRFNEGDSSRESYQLTPAWKMTVPLGESAFIFDGFADWVFGDGTDNLHFNPQFKFDVGALVGLKSRALLAGLDYDYWKNKYDIDGVNQHAYSAIVQYHF